MTTERKCSMCKFVKPIIEFTGKRGGVVTMCFGCREREKNVRGKRRETIAIELKEGQRQCSNCGQAKHVHEFISERSGVLCNMCSHCRDKNATSEKKHKERVVTFQKQYYRVNESTIRARTKKWSIDNRPAMLENKMKYRTSKATDIPFKIDKSRRCAHDRGIRWNLTDDQASVLFTGECSYCTEPVPPNKLNTIDRMDSMQGYFPDNCVSCCVTCNNIKGTVDARTFVNRCVHIRSHLTNGTWFSPSAWTDTMPGSYSSYRINALKKNRAFELTKEMYAHMVEIPCCYCRRDITETNKSGIDRIDSTKGYVEGNMVSCCSECNYMKGTLSREKFTQMVLRIGENAENIRIPSDMPVCLKSLAATRSKRKRVVLD